MALGQLSEQELIEAAEREPAKVGILAAAALVGGSALGAAMMHSMRQGWIEEPKLPEHQSVGEELAQFAVANVALVIGAASLRETILEMGRDEFLKTMALYGGGLFAFKLVVDGMRKLRRK